MTTGGSGPLPLASVRVLLDLRHDPLPAIRMAAGAALERLPLDPEAAAAAGVPPARVGARSLAPSLATVSPKEAAEAAEVARHLLAVGAEYLGDRRGWPLPGPALVTALVGALADAAAATAGWVVAWIAEFPAGFRPDINGLTAVHRRLLELLGTPERQVEAALLVSPEGAGLRRDIAWIISRGGPDAVVACLDGALRAPAPAARLAAVCLVAEVAALFHLPGPPPGGEDLAPVAVQPEPPDDSEVRGVHLPDAVTEASRAPADDGVQFTVYRPATIRPARWYPLLAFAHRTTPFTDPDGVDVDPLAEVERQARGLLGAAIGAFGHVAADSSATLPHGDEIVFEPWLEEGELNPPRSAVRWEEPVHRMDFRLRVPAHVARRRLQGGMRVYLGVLLIGEVRFALRVDPDATTTERQADPVTAFPYRRIFASYSHRDVEIVRRIVEAVAATGDRYLIDVHELRAGELWAPRLVEMITSADVFQLFWSHHSMRSPFVRREWEYALALGREGFIRPVYWEEPLPADDDLDLPPATLRRYHFCRLAAEVAGPTPTPCPDCGAIIALRARFCPVCGSSWLTTDSSTSTRHTGSYGPPARPSVRAPTSSPLPPSPTGPSPPPSPGGEEWDLADPGWSPPRLPATATRRWARLIIALLAVLAVVALIALLVAGPR